MTIRSPFTCSIRRNNAPATWIHVVAQDAREAAREAIAKTHTTGHCHVEVYPGNSIPINVEEAPVATETMIA